MNESDKKELIKFLFPLLEILDFIIVNEPFTLKELEEHFSKSRSTYGRLLNKFVEFGLLKRTKNSSKIKQKAQFIYKSTPELKIILNSLFHRISDLALKDNKVELTDPISFEFLNECLSFFSEVILPDVKDWFVAKWEEYSDPFTFYKDLSNRILQIVQSRLEDIIIKRMAEKSNNRIEISEET